MQSYFHLLKMRYGTALVLHQEVDERFLEAQLSQLTLQLLVENAVKHNILLPENPIVISILTTETGELVVANSIQRKTVRVPPTGWALPILRRGTACSARATCRSGKTTSRLR